MLRTGRRFGTIRAVRMGAGGPFGVFGRAFSGGGCPGACRGVLSAGASRDDGGCCGADAEVAETATGAADAGMTDGLLLWERARWWLRRRWSVLRGSRLLVVRQLRVRARRRLRGRGTTCAAAMATGTAEDSAERLRLRGRVAGAAVAAGVCGRGHRKKAAPRERDAAWAGVGGRRAAGISGASRAGGIPFRRDGHSVCIAWR